MAPRRKKTTRKPTSSRKSATAKSGPELDPIDSAEVEALVAPDEDRCGVPLVQHDLAEVDLSQAEDEPADLDAGPVEVPVQGVTLGTDGVTVGPETGGEPGLKLVKKDLVERVVARSGVKPRYVRQVTEALLAELGGMLEEAETLQLQPLGNVKVQRRRDVDDGEIIICKLRRKKGETMSNDPLAAAAE